MMFVFSEEIDIGIVVGLLTQLLSLMCLVALAYFRLNTYIFISWSCAALTLGVLVILFLSNGYILSAGFVLPYIAALLMPFTVLTSTVGSDAAILLKMNALILAGTYGVLSLLNLWQFSI